MSNYQADWLICERKRLGLTRKTLADHLAVADKTIQRWEADTPIPSDKLALLVGLGFDVLYILTGQRQQPVQSVTFASLDEREKELISHYRGTSDVGKRAVETTAFALANNVTAPKASGE